MGYHKVLRHDELSESDGEEEEEVYVKEDKPADTRKMPFK